MQAERSLQQKVNHGLRGVASTILEQKSMGARVLDQTTSAASN
jgi:hypothetical protein